MFPFLKKRSFMPQTLKQFFTRILQGSKISFLSFQAYAHYKKLLIIPAISALAFTVILFMFFGFFSVLNPLIASMRYHEVIGAFVLVVPLLFFTSCVHVFFNTVTAFLVADYCQQSHASIISACAKSFRKIAVLSQAAILVAFVKAGTRGKNNNLQGTIVEASWLYLSFFMYPLMAFEQLSFFDALKKSAALMKKYFGTVSGSLAVFSGLWRLIPFILIAATLFVLCLFKLINIIMSALGFEQALQNFANQLNSPLSMVLSVPLIIVFVFYMFECIGTAQVIISTLLYRHLQGQSTGFLSAVTLDQAIQEIKK